MSPACKATSVLRSLKNGPLSVGIIGSGNWGTTVAKIIAQNTCNAFLFQDNVLMYVHHELVDGWPLDKVINEKHENKRYLPGIALPHNINASSNLAHVTENSNILVFVMPHQFMRSMLSKMAGHIQHNTMAISLVKGFDVQHGQLRLMSELVHEELGIECASLSGANVASQVAQESFSEATIGCRNHGRGQLFQHLFHRNYYRVRCVADVHGVELCGALKNIVAIAAGFADGLNQSSNTKAALIRIGLEEMRRFAREIYDDVDVNTFFESCGVADLITTCSAGRNVRCAAMVARTGRSFKDVEHELLNGQKLQGTLTAREVYEVMEKRKMTSRYDLFAQTYRVCYEAASPKSIVEVLMISEPQ